MGATHRKETRTGNVNSVSVLEVLDSSTDGSLELDNGGTVVGDLGVDDDVELHSTGFHDALQRLSRYKPEEYQN